MDERALDYWQQAACVGGGGVGQAGHVGGGSGRIDAGVGLTVGGQHGRREGGVVGRKEVGGPSGV